MELTTLAFVSVVFCLVLLTQSWFRLLLGCLIYFIFMLWSATQLTATGAPISIVIAGILLVSTMLVIKLVRLAETAEDYEDRETSEELRGRSKNDHSLQDFMAWKASKNQSKTPRNSDD
ncbi:MAG: hypothetical protein P1U54_06460 [Immundisolibacteraceae bacterium]|nr:hypothetical protein [Immundisolibacteraceae bacterium]